MKFILIFLLISLALFYGCREESHLYKYEVYPCKNQVFTSESTISRVHLGDSYMNSQLFYLTRDMFEDTKYLTKHPHSTKYKIKKTYTEGSQFKIIGYYAGVTYPCASRCSQGFLVKSLEDNKYAWIPNNALDTKECKLAVGNPYENNKHTFGISGYGLGKNKEHIFNTSGYKKRPYIE